MPDEVHPDRWQAGQSGRGTDSSSAASRQDVLFAYRLLLGREPEGEAAYAAKAGLPLIPLLRSLLASEEFTAGLPDRFLARRDASGGCLEAGPDAAMLAWAAERLPLSRTAIRPIREAATRARLHRLIFTDPEFQRRVGAGSAAAESRLLEELWRLDEWAGDPADGAAAAFTEPLLWLVVAAMQQGDASVIEVLVHDHPGATLILRRLTDLVQDLDAGTVPGNSASDEPSPAGDGRPSAFDTIAAAACLRSLASEKDLRLVGTSSPVAGEWEDIDVLASRLPELRAALVIRDPADAVRRMLLSSSDAPPPSVQRATALWVMAWNRLLALKVRFGDAVLVLKSEEIGAAPADVADRFYAWLGLPPHLPSVRLEDLVDSAPTPRLPAAADELLLDRLLGPVIQAWPAMTADQLTEMFADLLPPYLCGDRVALSSREAGAYLAHGFSFREAWGRWTDGPRAMLAVRHGDATGLLLVEIWVCRSWAPPDGVCDVILTVGWCEPKLFTLGSGSTRIALVAPAAETSDAGLLELEILVASPKPPDQLPADARALGIGIEAFRITRLAGRSSQRCSDDGIGSP